MGWRLSKRLAAYPAVAAALRPVERTGVRLTYEVHDRVWGNPLSRRLLREQPPVLDAVQQRVVDQLTASGIAVIPFADLCPDPAVWRTLAEDAARFVAAAEQRLRNADDPARAQLRKKHIVRRHALGVELPLADPWLTLGVSTRLLDIVNAYLAMYAKCLYVDQWYTVPAGAGDRVSSQRWHRDYTDTHLVKVFIYLSDVDAESGPFEYIRGSAGDGPYSREFPWRPLSDTYPPEDALLSKVRPADVVSCLGPAGTTIFCNTSGFHRGGFATRAPRAMAVYNYASAASLRSLAKRNFRLAEHEVPSSLPASVRFALT